MTGYRELGLRPVVNAAATLTVLGGSRLAPPAAATMTQASREFVDLPELASRVGARIAELTGNEAGYVSSGGSAGVTLSVAACVSGDIEAFGPPVACPAVAMFRGHRNPYDYAVRQLGARILEFDADVDLAADDIACVLWFAGEHYAAGAPDPGVVIAAAHARGIPVVVDAAAQIPPVASLWRFTAELGADVAVFSGGKGLRGPQSTGLVLGRAQIVAGARAHGAPHHAVGRGMKVGKEELLGLLAAVEWTLAQDEAALLARYEEAVSVWCTELALLPGITVARGYPSEAGQPHSRALVRTLPGCPLSAATLRDALWDRDPRIAVLIDGDAIALNPQTLDPGEELLVLQAFREILA